jgi:hypothetical protein
MPAPDVDQSPWSGAGICLAALSEARPVLVSRLS